MTFRDAAHEILRRAGQPLHYKEITRLALEQGLVVTKGKTPTDTMYVVITTEIKRGGLEGRPSHFTKVGRGIFGLAEWKGKIAPSTPLAESPEVQITSRQHDMLRKYVKQFEARLRKELSDAGWRKEREERSAWFQRALSPGNIETLSADEFGKIIRSLWASRLWTNKDYLVANILEQNEMDHIRASLKDLLHSRDPLDQRFDRCKIKGLGPSSITETLVFFDPQQYCLWNDKPKNVLPLLGMKKLVSDRAYKYPINGRDYVRCNQALGLVRDELASCGFPDLDFLDVDIFMWLLFTEVVKKQPVIPSAPLSEPEIKPEPTGLVLTDHWDAVACLVELGNLLGYDTYVSDPGKTSTLFSKKLGDLADLQDIPPFTLERYLDTIRYVDVIWFRDEFPAACFEVEHSTNVTKGLLRLFQIRRFTDARFFIVAPTSVRSKFDTETSKDPFHQIRNRYNFRSYDELATFYTQAKTYHALKRDFLG